MSKRYSQMSRGELVAQLKSKDIKLDEQRDIIKQCRGYDLLNKILRLETSLGRHEDLLSQYFNWFSKHKIMILEGPNKEAFNQLNHEYTQLTKPIRLR